MLRLLVIVSVLAIPAHLLADDDDPWGVRKAFRTGQEWGRGQSAGGAFMEAFTARMYQQQLLQAQTQAALQTQMAQQQYQQYSAQQQAIAYTRWFASEWSRSLKPLADAHRAWDMMLAQPSFEKKLTRHDLDAIRYQLRYSKALANTFSARSDPAWRDLMATTSRAINEYEQAFQQFQGVAEGMLSKSVLKQSLANTQWLFLERHVRDAKRRATQSGDEAVLQLCSFIHAHPEAFTAEELAQFNP